MRIAILGGGPSGLFLYKQFLDSGKTDFIIEIFEAGDRLGPGMPYSSLGANIEHVTNVSANEIPALVTPLRDWIETLPVSTLEKFDINKETFNEYKVIPRLLFGEYLEAQFSLLREKADKAGLTTVVHFKSTVTDIIDEHAKNLIQIETNGENIFTFDIAIMSTGHIWPQDNKEFIHSYFNSPYPPAKLNMHLDHAVAIRGGSLTATDAVRTLARHHGFFLQETPHRLSYRPHDNAENFKIVMHSRHGILPCIRFHLEDPHLSKETLLSPDDLAQHIKENGGFLSLDFIFEKDFKESFRNKDQAFYAYIRNMTLEEYVAAMMEMREKADPFTLFKQEYAEARESIQRKRSIYWKEMLAVLSFAINYPAKHMSAEDMLRLHHTLLPLISIVIAFMPQSSCDELIALHEAGRLELVSVDADSHIEINKQDGSIIYQYTDDDGSAQSTHYKTYIDCVGQPHLSIQEFPFKSLIKNGTVSQARLRFKDAGQATSLLKENGRKDISLHSSGEYYLDVPGLSITDDFEAIGIDGAANNRFYLMAVPYIGGYNPDYSGLDFCEHASGIITRKILLQL